MKKQRLLKLADHLENNVMDHEFDMKEWKCGTTACAVGHAASIPSFQRAGLKLVSYRMKVSGDGYKAFCPIYKGDYGYLGVANFFGIGVDEAHSLFDPDEYPIDRRDVRTVAKRIREFVR